MIEEIQQAIKYMENKKAPAGSGGIIGEMLKARGKTTIRRTA